MDRALDFLYGDDERSAGSGASSPHVATWLGDIRRYFPREVVAFMEKDAIERKGLKQLLLEPEALQSLEKDVGLVATILAFKHLMPEQTRADGPSGRGGDRRRSRRRLENQTRQALLGAMRRDRHSPLKVARNLDLRRTVREGLRQLSAGAGQGDPGADPFLRQPAAVPRVAGHHPGGSERLDGRVGGVLVDRRRRCSRRCRPWTPGWCSSTPALLTSAISFPIPVEILFGVQLGGGTDIAKAVRYGASLVGQPDKTLLLLITDLYEGGSQAELLQQLGALRESRVNVLCVLALNDSGTASFDGISARKVANLDIPTFAGHAEQAGGCCRAGAAGRRERWCRRCLILPRTCR